MIKPPDSGKVSGLHTRWSSADGSTVTLSNPVGVANVYGVLSSVNTPGFKAIPKRSLPNHPFTYQREVWDFTPGYLAVRNSSLSVTYIFRGYWRAYLGYSSSSFDYECRFPWPVLDSQAKALSKLQGKIAKSSVNLAQAYAERAQTVSMLAQSIGRLARLALYIKSGKFQAANKFIREHVPGARSHFPRTVDVTPKKAAGQFSDLWLEYTFGWTPFVSDIYGSAEALARAHNPDRRLSFSAQAESSQEAVRTWFSSYPFGSVQFDENIEYSQREVTRYQLQVVEDQTLLSQLASVGLSNPALLAWEVLPFSFVWDWIQPIGPYLEQLEYARGLTFSSGTVTTRRFGEGTVQATATFSSDWWADGPQGPFPTVKVRHDSKVRQVLTDFPYAEFPAFKPSLGIKRAVTSLALLTQVFRGKKTPR